METFYFILIVLAAAGLYLLPALIANNPKNQTAIFWVNILFGWTGLIWLVLLVLALATRK